MKLILFLVVFYYQFICSCSLYTQKQSLTYATGYNTKVTVSQSGHIMIAGNTNLNMIIYELIDGQYSQIQSFYHMESIKSVYISEDQSTIVSSRSNSFQVYKRDSSTGLYSLFQQVTVLNLVRAKITNDLNNILVAGYDPVIQNFHFNGSLYVLVQNITEMSDSIIDIDLTSDGLYFVCGGYEQRARIYKRNGIYFNFIQKIDVNFRIFQISLSDDASVIIVAGVSSSMKVYRGSLMSGYILDSMHAILPSTAYTLYSTSQPRVISVAGSSSVIRLYQDINQTVSLYQDIVMNESTVMATWIDKTASVLVIATNVNTYIYYKCAKQYCNDCSLIYICSVCQTGYELRNGSCQFILVDNTTDTNISAQNNQTNTTDSTNNTIGDNTTDSTNNTIGDNTTDSTNNTIGDNTTDSTNNTIGDNTTDSTNNTIGDNTTDSTNNTIGDNTTDSTINSIETNSITIIPPGNNVNDISVQQELQFVCVDGYSQGLCYQYCDPSCQECHGQPKNCSKCSDGYMITQDRECIIKEQGISVAIIAMSILSIIRQCKIKSLLFMLDDIWLYQYHKPEYMGVPKIVFETARIIETKKDEFISHEKIQFIETIENSLRRYDTIANKKYLLHERRDDSLPQNIIDFTFQVIPVTLCIFGLFKLLFWLFYNYPISKYIRSLSFNGFLAISLIQGNIQYFVFLGFRNIKYLFAEIFTDKLYSVFVIIFLFPIILYAFSAYFLLRCEYKKLYKYFLDNMYRISGASWLMMILYCVRPFLRGCVHSLLYESNGTQLFLLAMIDFFTFLAISKWQIIKNIYKSVLCFGFLCVYLLTSVPLNLFLFICARYQTEEMLQISDISLQVLFYIRLVCLILGFIFNLFELYTFQPDPFKEMQLQGQKVQVLINQNVKASYQDSKQKTQGDSKNSKKNIKQHKNRQQRQKSLIKPRKAHKRNKKQNTSVHFEQID